MSRLSRGIWVGLCLLAAALSAAAQSQATTGVIEGIVLDSSGALVAAAALALANTETNYRVELVSDSRGQFRAVLLPLGPYRVSVHKEGFETREFGPVSLSLGQTVRLPIVLEPAGVHETVRVSGEPPQIDTAASAAATTLVQPMLRELPARVRDFLGFARLAPGVATVQGTFGPELSINGQQSIQTGVTIDGLDARSSFFSELAGGQLNPLRFNLDAIRELSVVTDGASAEFGRSSGGFVNVVTRSGTNRLAGNAYVLYRNDGTAAAAVRPDGSLEKTAFNQTQAGATLGGALVRDRLFGFVALDGVAGGSTKQTDPARIEPRVVDAFAGLGDPGENLSIGRSTRSLLGFAKLDGQISASAQASLRYSYSQARLRNASFDVDSFGTSYVGSEHDTTHSVGGDTVLTISRSLFDEFRAQWTRWDGPHPWDGPVPSSGRALPDTSFDFARQYRFGKPFSLPIDVSLDTRWQVKDTLTAVAGQHTIKMGAEYSHGSLDNQITFFADGRWIFSSTDGFLSYLSNPLYRECSGGVTSQTGACPAGMSVTGPVLLYLQLAPVGNLTLEDAGRQALTQKEPGAFIQDTWQPAPNLTINAGLRWEAQIAPNPITPPGEVFYAPFIGKVSNGQEFPSDGKYRSHYDLWQPRLGAVWDPWNDGKTAVRASGGIFYNQIPGINYNPSQIFNGSRAYTVFSASFLQNFGLPGPPPYPYTIPLQFLASPFRPGVFVVDKDLKAPRTYSASFGVERQIADGISAYMKYSWAQGENRIRFFDRNDPLLGSPWSAGIGPGGVNGLGSLTVVESNGHSRYNGLTVGLSRRSADWSADVNYTLSSSYSDGDNDRNPFVLEYAKITDLSAEWGYSDNDQRHAVNAWFLWNAPCAFQLSGRYAYRSAQPQSLTPGGQPAASPSDRIRPDGTVVRRNTGRKDNAFSSFDLSVSRPFQVSGMSVTPIVQVFNLFNAKNLSNPVAQNLVFDNGLAIRSGAGDPRQFQFGLEFKW